MLAGHASHQIGLDADIWLILCSPAARRETLLSLQTTRTAVSLGSCRKRGTMMFVFWESNDGALLQKHYQNS